MKQNVLVTGGAGYLGSVLVGHLLRDLRISVDVVDSLCYGPQGLLYFGDDNFVFHNLDIRNEALMNILFKRNQFTTVIHTAALVGEGVCKKYPEDAGK